MALKPNPDPKPTVSLDELKQSIEDAAKKINGPEKSSEKEKSK